METLQWICIITLSIAFFFQSKVNYHVLQALKAAGNWIEAVADEVHLQYEIFSEKDNADATTDREE